MFQFRGSKKKNFLFINDAIFDVYFLDTINLLHYGWAQIYYKAKCV